MIGGLVDGGRERLQDLSARFHLPLDLPKERYERGTRENLPLANILCCLKTGILVGQIGHLAVEGIGRSLQVYDVIPKPLDVPCEVGGELDKVFASYRVSFHC